MSFIIKEKHNIGKLLSVVSILSTHCILNINIICVLLLLLDRNPV